jgi:hypothetical protein
LRRTWIHSQTTLPSGESQWRPWSIAQVRRKRRPYIHGPSPRYAARFLRSLFLIHPSLGEEQAQE